MHNGNKIIHACTSGICVIAGNVLYALPPAVVEVLREYKKTVDSRWMFPSPVKESPTDSMT